MDNINYSNIQVLSPIASHIVKLLKSNGVNAKAKYVSKYGDFEITDNLNHDSKYVSDEEMKNHKIWSKAIKDTKKNKFESELKANRISISPCWHDDCDNPTKKRAIMYCSVEKHS